MSSNQPEPSRADLAESMPAQANEFVQACKAKGVSLDYQLRTLPLVDKFISGVRAEVEQLTIKKDPQAAELVAKHVGPVTAYLGEVIRRETDRKSTRLNSSHGYISYAVFCLKKKNKVSRGSYYRSITQ